VEWSFYENIPPQLTLFFVVSLLLIIIILMSCLDIKRFMRVQEIKKKVHEEIAYYSIV